MINVIVNGAHGRMGKEAVIAVENDKDLNLVAAIGRGDDLAKHIAQTKAQVVVDLTSPDAVFNNAQTIIDCDASPIIGTSGLTLDQIDTLKHACAQRKLGGLIAPNFSVGAVLMMKLSEQIAAYLPDAEIIEMHHPNKKDAPSGTALKTAEAINAGRKQSPQAVATAPGDALGHNHQNVPIHAIRLPGLIAHQTVLFGGDHETLSIRHDSFHRLSFMPGIVLACKKTPTLKEMVYGLEHLL